MDADAAAKAAHHPNLRGKSHSVRYLEKGLGNDIGEYGGGGEREREREREREIE